MLCSPTLISHGDKSLYVRNRAVWASPFYMHNDNAGPYLPIEDTGPKEAYTLGKVCYAVALLPGDVNRTAEEAEQAAVRLIDRPLRSDRVAGKQNPCDPNLPA